MKKTLLLIILMITISNYSQTQRLDSITQNDFKMIFSYNNDIYQGFEMKSLENSIWINKTKTTVTYNSDGLVDMLIVKRWNGSEYVNDAKEIYQYNSNQQISTITFFGWNVNVWENNGLGTYNYTNNLKMEYVQEQDNKVIYNYDVNNLLTKLEIFDWIENSNTFSQTTDHKYEYSYDSENNIEQMVQWIKNSNDVWTIEQTTDFSYDNNINRESLIVPFELINPQGAFVLWDFNHKITETMVDNDSSTLMIYHYSNTTTADVLDYKNSISIYPNPTINQVKFDIPDFEKIEIYDITGKLITKTKTNIVNMENVPNGTYLYRIQKGNETINGKIIKK